MAILTKKGSGRVHELVDSYIPAPLPTPESGLVSGKPYPGLETYVTGSYLMNVPEYVDRFYKAVDEELAQVATTCDKYSTGRDMDQYVDVQIEKIYADLEGQKTEHEHLCARIRCAIKARIDTVNEKINNVETKIDKCTKVITPLEGLRAQFSVQIKNKTTISMGALFTAFAIVFDSIVNFTYFQTVLISHFALLIITVIGCAFLSDLSMMCLGVYVSHRREDFTSEHQYYVICAALLSLFIVSVIASVMIRLGSMPETYGTIDSAGKVVPPESYSLAQYGITLLTSFVTTCTGIISYALSNDKNAYLVNIRKKAEKEREMYVNEATKLRSELSVLENIPDPEIRDKANREAAIMQIEALRTALKLHCRKLMIVRINDAEFTEAMTESGDKVLAESKQGTKSIYDRDIMDTNTLLRIDQVI